MDYNDIGLILVNGDSYSRKRMESHGIKVYSDFIQEKTNIPVINLALMGSNNSRIIKTTVEHLLRHKDKNIMCIIGYSFIQSRWELGYYSKNELDTSAIPHVDTNYMHDYGFDIPVKPLFITSSWLDDKQLKKYVNDPAFETTLMYAEFYNQLYMLSKMLDSLNIKYFIFSAADNNIGPDLNIDFINSLQVTNEINANPNILTDFSVASFGKDNNLVMDRVGHLMTEYGYEKLSDFILNKIEHL
jgi:hypothetical protein